MALSHPVWLGLRLTGGSLWLDLSGASSLRAQTRAGLETLSMARRSPSVTVGSPSSWTTEELTKVVSTEKTIPSQGKRCSWAVTP